MPLGSFKGQSPKIAAQRLVEFFAAQNRDWRTQRNQAMRVEQRLERIEEDAPSGTFADFNPAVSCDSTAAEAHMAH